MNEYQIISLSEAQAEQLEQKLAAFDEQHIHYRLDGAVEIGICDNGRLIAGLSAEMTVYKILYVSTVYVDEAYRRRGLGAALMREMEKRAGALGANLIRLDTFDWQGKAFYEALGYEIVGSYSSAEDGFSEYFFLKRL